MRVALLMCLNWSFPCRVPFIGQVVAARSASLAFHSAFLHRADSAELNMLLCVPWPEACLGPAADVPSRDLFPMLGLGAQSRRASASVPTHLKPEALDVTGFLLDLNTHWLFPQDGFRPYGSPSRWNKELIQQQKASQRPPKP